MTNLLDPKMDYIFKNIFGKKDKIHLLISLLNSLLFEGEPRIQKLTIENPNLDKILKEDKSSRLDVRATIDNNTMIDIEIQCKNTGEIPQRAFHYLANMMPHVVKTNESYKQVRVIGIWLLGENVTNRQNAIGKSYMTFQPNGLDPYEIMNDNAMIIFIELLKFNPKKEAVNKLLTAWLEFLKDPVFMDEKYLKVQEVHEAMDTLKYISSDPDLRAIADLRQKTINDKNSELTIAIENAKTEGIAEGKAEGIAEGKRETAIKMLSKGMNIDDIADLTGLTITEVQNLPNKK